MKKHICIFLILSVVAISSSNVAQAYTITFNMGAVGQTVASGTVLEGEIYVVPEVTLTGLAAAFQPYWNALEGATMRVPSGALNSDIVVNVEFTNFNIATGRFLDLGGEAIFLSLDYTVEGYEEFEFNEGYPMILTLPLDSEMLFLLELAGLDLTSRLTLAYWIRGKFITIPTIQTETGLRAEISHLSTIVGKEAPLEVIKIVPPQTRVLVGKTKQFSIAGEKPDAIAWESLYPDVGTVDENGLFEAVGGGFTVIMVKDPKGDIIGSTGEIIVMGGPTKIHPERGGRAFSQVDTLSFVNFPPQASKRAMIARVQKRGRKELPPKAKGRERVVVVFDITATDAETGEDVGKKGFGKKVRMTLHYEDEEVPEGVDEEDLEVAELDEETGDWEGVPEEDVVEVDREDNTITVDVESFSIWAVLDRAVIAPPAVVESSTWGEIKSLHR